MEYGLSELQKVAWNMACQSYRKVEVQCVTLPVATESAK